jgi:23S rRNA pseudouridine2605 synthase
MMAERLQKFLAGAGLGSRRQIEAWIAQGRITVDGESAELGQKVSGGEQIRIDGRLVRLKTRPSRVRIIIYNKPPGEICTRSDPQGRRTIFDSLPDLSNARWVSVGRLDVQTSGVLVLTTDGNLAHRLMHPSAELQREYAVRVLGEPSRADLRKLRDSVSLEGGPAHFDDLQFTGGEGANRWYRVVVSEGRNQIVRRLFEAIDCRVSRLIRIRYGSLRLPRSLRQGEYRPLTDAEMTSLLAAAGRAERPGATRG